MDLREDYRADIDGLRAIAVLAVTVFHAFPTLLPAGFVGVDVFFVISGFVITRTIARELAQGRFAVTRFYARRVRRLFPALALCVTATLALAWFVLLPGEFAALGRQAVAGGLSVANLQFLRESSYFDAATTGKPLMHLWSLGVEEQFYLCWPVLFMLLWRTRHAHTLTLIVALLSLVSAAWWVRQDQSVAFYSPFTRAWELLAGAFLALPRTSGYMPGLSKWSSIRSTLGLGLVLSGIIIGSSVNPVAGLDMMVPVIGAALVVSGGSGPAARLLSTTPMRWLGRISYPFYLWHWPLLAFRNLVTHSGSETTLYTLASILIAVVLADLTCRFLERPVRESSSPQRATYLSIAALMTPIAFALIILMLDGLPLREVALDNSSAVTAKVGSGKEFTVHDCLADEGKSSLQFCARDASGPPDAAVWGDSKGEALYWGMLREGRRTERTRWLLLGNPGCVPSDIASHVASCDLGNRIALQALMDEQVRTVLLVFATRSMAGRMADSERGVAHVARALLSAGKQVVLVIDNPTVTGEFDKPSTCARLLKVPFLTALADGKRCHISYAGHVASTREYRAAIDRIAAANPGMVVFDMAPVLCDISRDVCPVVQGGKYLYSYGDHISDTANEKVAKVILPMLGLGKASGDQ